MAQSPFTKPETAITKRSRRTPVEMLQVDRYLKENYGALPVDRIAEHLNEKPSWVYNRAYQLEISSTPESKENVSGIEAQDQIYALSQEGISDFEIAVKFDARVSDVRVVISAMGALRCN